VVCDDLNNGASSATSSSTTCGLLLAARATGLNAQCDAAQLGRGVLSRIARAAAAEFVAVLAALASDDDLRPRARGSPAASWANQKAVKVCDCSLH
jgi:hypothetical protein